VFSFSFFFPVHIPASFKLAIERPTTVYPGLCTLYLRATRHMGDAADDNLSAYGNPVMIIGAGQHCCVAGVAAGKPQCDTR